MVQIVTACIVSVVFLVVFFSAGRWWRAARQRDAYLLDEREKARLALEHEREVKQLTWEQENPPDPEAQAYAEVLENRRLIREALRYELDYARLRGTLFDVKRASQVLEDREKAWLEEDNNRGGRCNRRREP